jgi:hypothetical protein
MSNVAKLKERLYGVNGLGATNFKLFPGVDRNATPEAVAGEILRALDALDSNSDELTACEN